MNAADAIQARRAMHAAVGDIDELHAAVGERLAVRDPPGDWLVASCPYSVRLFLKVGDAYVSRYVWRWERTDWTIDLLLGRGAVDDSKK